MDDDEFADLLSRPPTTSSTSAATGIGMLSDNPWGAPGDGDAFAANPFADLSSAAASPFSAPVEIPIATSVPASPPRAHYAFAPPSPDRDVPVSVSPPAFATPAAAIEPPLQLLPSDDEEEKPLRQMMPKARAGHAKAETPAAAGHETAAAPIVPEESKSEDVKLHDDVVGAEQAVPGAEEARAPSPSPLPSEPDVPTDVEKTTPEEIPQEDKAESEDEFKDVETGDKEAVAEPEVALPSSPQLESEEDSKPSPLVDEAPPPALQTEEILAQSKPETSQPETPLTVDPLAAQAKLPPKESPKPSPIAARIASTPLDVEEEEDNDMMPNPLAPAPPAPKPSIPVAPPAVNPASVPNPLSSIGAAKSSAPRAVFDPLGANTSDSAAGAKSAANGLPAGPAKSTPSPISPLTARAAPANGPQPLIPPSAFGNVVNPLAASAPAPRPSVASPVVPATPSSPKVPSAAASAPPSPLRPSAPSSIIDPLAAPQPKPDASPSPLPPAAANSGLSTPQQPPPRTVASTTATPPTEPAPEPPKPVVLPKFEVSVGEPQRVGGIDAHTTYRIRTKTNFNKFRNPDVNVNRRYRDFLWLGNQLGITHPGVVIPPLPEKQAMGRFQEDFVESRRVALERFLQKVVAHPLLFDDADVRVFLESETFSADVSMLTKKDPTKSGGMFSAFSMSGVTQYRATPDKDELLDTKKVEIEKFESQLRQLLKGVEALVKQRKDLGTATSDMGDAFIALGSAEGDPELAKKLKMVGNISRKIKELHEKQAEHDVSYLAYSVEEYIRFCGSVEQAYQSRTRYWNNVKSAEGAVMNKRLALDKARAAGKKGDKLTALQTDIDEVSWP